MAKKKAEADAEIKALRKELLKEGKRSNALLQRIQAQIGDKESYAGKRLIAKLSNAKVNGLTDKGYVRIGGNLSVAQMRAILKAVKDFNASKTSRIKGIQEAKQSTIKSLGLAFDVTELEASKLYEFLGSEEYVSSEINNIMCEVMVAGIDTKEKNGDYEFFIKQLGNLGISVNLKDETLQNDLIGIYRKYFK